MLNDVRHWRFSLTRFHDSALLAFDLDHLKLDLIDEGNTAECFGGRCRVRGREHHHDGRRDG